MTPEGSVDYNYEWERWYSSSELSVYLISSFLIAGMFNFRLHQSTQREILHDYLLPRPPKPIISSFVDSSSLYLFCIINGKQFTISNFQFPALNIQFPISNFNFGFQIPILNFQFPIFRFQFSTLEFQFIIIEFQTHVSNCGIRMHNYVSHRYSY